MIFNLSKYSSLVLLVFLSSCSNQVGCKKVDLSKDEMSWFDNFENGDIIYFTSQNNEVDTFIIKISAGPSYTVCNKFELGPNIYASHAVSFKSHDSYKFDAFDDGYYLGFNKIGLDSTVQKCSKYLSFFDLRTGSFFDFSKVPKEVYTNSKTGEKIDIFVYSKNINCSNIDGGTEIMQQFAISKKYGLIWYRTIKGDYYQRIW